MSYRLEFPDELAVCAVDTSTAKSRLDSAQDSQRNRRTNINTVHSISHVAYTKVLRDNNKRLKHSL